ncbi:AbrB family transcriptional regulator [Bifidobacterium longum]|nr:AbrB family transcriptional regulator [Bifidobacterium longum]
MRLDDEGTLKYEPQRINPWHTKAIQKIDFKAMKKEIGIVSEESSRGKEV